MDETRTRCAVVGAGLTGLVAAHRLAQAGWSVTVHERYPEAGGLVATFAAGGERLERFYHHLFTTDGDYVRLAAELGLTDAIEWLPSRMGIYSHGALWDFGTPGSLLRFRPLPWAAKVRFALATLYLRTRRNVEEFEPVTAHEWILRHAGPRVWDTLWGPLMRQKFADRSGDVSMAWLWRKVYLRGRSRTSTGWGESLGYMRGSFGRLIDVLVERLGALGVDLRFAAPALHLGPAVEGVELRTRSGTALYDVVLFTAAPQELLAVAGDHLRAAGETALPSLDAAGALCVVLELDRPLQRYYWLNIADRDFPFGGVIEHTNYVPAARYGGRHIVYLSKYLFADDPLWAMRGEDVWALYRPWLARINPAFADSWVLDRHHFKAAYAQPIVPCHYSRLIPPFDTPLPRLHHACMAQIYPEDRGQNYAVRAGEDAARRLLAQYG